MRNTISSDPVADFFLMQTDENSGDSITNLKLQKLCYYAQAWHLTLRKAPMFGDRIEAWAHGPVVPRLYRRFKNFKWACISPEHASSDPFTDLHSTDISFLETVWKRYGSLTGKQLEILTHREAPWKKAYGNRPLGSLCTEEITHDAMVSYYRTKLLKAA